jgi:serine/threonine protein kinase
MPIVVGETLGAYRIIEQLGQGGMATVFKAYHAALDRYVAIKALHPAFKEDVNFLARFQREARVVARLDHPNIVPIYDFSEHEGRPYLVMKFIEGETLKARLAQRKLSFGEIIVIVDAVGKALTYAHQQGILHRDVKPSNVLLAKDGQIYLADFGLARIASAGESTLSSDMMLGTPQYISPEQAMGKRELDEGTDIYSFGVLLYELLVGKVPFSADTPYAIIHDHIYSPLPMPHSINPKISDDIERVLLKALAKERADRYTTVNEMVESFKGACSGYEESALPVETVETQVAAIPAVLTKTKIPTAAEPVSGIQKPTVLGTASEGEPVTPVAERPAIIPVSDEEPAGPPAETSLPKLVPARKPLHKRWYVWLLVIAGIFGVCLSALIARGMIKNKQASVGQAIPTATQAPQEITKPLDLLQQARRKVDENPNDPDVHLNLAVLLIDARQFEDVARELNRVEGLMGDPGYYIEHGMMYRDQQKWIAAAWAYLRARELNPDLKTGEAIDLWHEAVYKAFMDPEAGRVVDLERIRVIDGPMAGVARVQAELTAGNVGRAETIILEVIKQFENFPEALLVQARVFARLKNTDRVGKILDTLKQIKNLPPWIRDEISRIEAVEKPKP